MVEMVRVVTLLLLGSWALVLLAVMLLVMCTAGCASLFDHQSTEPPKTYLGLTTIEVNARSRETQRLAGLAYSGLRYGRIDDILEVGLHGYLTEFLGSTAGLGNRIAQDFLVPMS